MADERNRGEHLPEAGNGETEEEQQGQKGFAGGPVALPQRLKQRKRRQLQIPDLLVDRQNSASG